MHRGKLKDADKAPTDDPREASLDESFGRAVVMSRLFGETKPAPRIGRFTLIERVGAGGMGQVWSAWDPKLDRRVALKLLHTSDGPQDERVLREARMMASINHPNVAQVYEVETQDSRIFIALEFVSGATLRVWQRDPERSWQEIVAMYVQAGQGLAAAHHAGVVHRDFKPDNALVGSDERVRVVDFGLAHVDSSAVVTADSSGLGDPSRESVTRARAGTPGYMAPEQFRGGTVDARADQFAFCVSLFEALTGERPFDGATHRELLESAERGNIPVQRLPSRIPGRVRQALVQGLRPEPAERFVSMEALLERLQLDPRRTRGRWLFLAGGVVVSAGMVSVLNGSSATTCVVDEARLGRAWSPSRRADVVRAIEETSVPYSAALEESISGAIDDWAGRWLAQREETCSATHVRKEQSEALLDRRMACLDRKLVELDALTRVLTETSSETVEQLWEVVASLPDLEACTRPQNVGDLTEPGPDLRAPVERLRVDLATVDALKVAGRYAEGLEMARRVVAEAASLEYEPLIAEAMLARGRLEQRSGDAATAETTLEDALVIAEAVQHDAIVLAARTELTWTVGYMNNRLDDGLRWGRLSGATLRRLQLERSATAAELHGNLGAMLSRYRRFEDARREYETALAIDSRLANPDESSRATHVYNLGLLEKDVGDLDAAQRHLEQAHTIFERAYGPDHPTTANAVQSLGLVAYRRGAYSRATALHEQALVSFERVLGPDHEFVVTALNGLANAAERSSRLEEAEAYHRKSLGIIRRSHGETHMFTGLARINFGNVLLARDRYEDALGEHVAALEILQGTLGQRHGVLAHALSGQGRALLALARPQEAQVVLARAWALSEEDADADSLLRGQIAAALARVHWEAGLHDRAIACGRVAQTAIQGSATATALERDSIAGWLREHVTTVDDAVDQACEA